MQRRECRWLRQGHDRLERQRVAVGVVPVGHTADRVTQDFNRRFRHVLVVVGRTGLPEILQDPGRLFAGFHVLLVLHARQLTETLKLLVGTRRSAEEHR